MLAAALEAEVDVDLAELADSRDERGCRLVVRNGYARPREVMTAAGAVEVRAPRVNDKRVDAQTGERKRFRSVILPPWCRKSPKVAEVLPLLYLHGLSTGDFVPALESFLGSAAGLSARRRTGHGVQAHRVRPTTLASSQRTAPGRLGPRRCHLPQRGSSSNAQPTRSPHDSRRQPAPMAYRQADRVASGRRLVVRPIVTAADRDSRHEG
jgi:Transposase, Mutator family